jgi:hypothetical protein
VTRAVLTAARGGLTELQLTHAGPGQAMTGHDLDDLEAALAQRKARITPCPAYRGDHACWLPSGHSPARHACRAGPCPETWWD